mmetsp:Transcript_16726/g.31646  ORF Transcript_16726/g.31646 Transcript_16726/m.31646 type:complete len:205 (+) Transcript_16726:380-994(+)
MASAWATNFDSCWSATEAFPMERGAVASALAQLLLFNASAFAAASFNSFADFLSRSSWKAATLRSTKFCNCFCSKLLLQEACACFGVNSAKAALAAAKAAAGAVSAERRVEAVLSASCSEVVADSKSAAAVSTAAFRLPASGPAAARSASRAAMRSAKAFSSSCSRRASNGPRSAGLFTKVQRIAVFKEESVRSFCKTTGSNNL